MSLQKYSKYLLLMVCAMALLLPACSLLPGSGGDDVVDIPQTGGEPAPEGDVAVVEENGDVAPEASGEETVAVEGEGAAEETTAVEGEGVADEVTTEDGGEETAETTTEEASPRADEEGGEEGASEEGAADGETTAVEGEGAADGATAETTTEEATAEATTEETTETAETTEASPAGSTEERTHVVADGENLYRIGLQYGVSWVVLQQHNNLSNSNSLAVGQEIKIPATEAPDTAEPAPTPTPASTDEQTHTVQEGDNLFRIGLEYGLDWTQIAEANGIVNPQQLTVGQVLKIPASQPGDSPEFTHVVKDGETLFLISVQYGTTWNSIAEANELSSPYVIYPDQTLIIPGN